MRCDGWGGRLTIYIANSPIIIDHHRSPTLRETIDFSITSHFQMASTEMNMSETLNARHCKTSFYMLNINSKTMTGQKRKHKRVCK